MKRLYLLQAAQVRTDPSANLSEYHLPLTRRGEIRAIQFGKYMQKHGYSPDLIICAGPARVRQTLSNMWPYLHSPSHPAEVIHDYRVHLMTGEGLLSQLQQLDERHKAVLLLGTYPGINELARLIKQSTDNLPDASSPEKAPAGFMVFDCGNALWKTLASGSAQLLETFNARLF